MMKNMFVLHFFSMDFVLFWMCVVVDCDDLAMNGVFPLEDFNRYVAVSVVECLRVTLLEIALETTWDFIWGVFDTCARLYLRFYLGFLCEIMFLSIYLSIYLYILYCLWLYQKVYSNPEIKYQDNAWNPLVHCSGLQNSSQEQKKILSG